MVDVGLAKISIASLPANKVPKDQETKNPQAGCATPVNKWVSEEVVFNNTFIPGTHAKTNLKYRPLPEFRRKIILLVWVRDKSVVGCHHGNIQVNKVLEKFRLVGSRITRRHYNRGSVMLYKGHAVKREGNLRRSL